MPQFSFEADGGLTVADLAAAGVLRELGGYLYEPGTARGFLIGIGYPPAKIEAFIEADVFWAAHARKIALGVAPFNLTEFTRHVFARFPLIRDHAERHGLVLPPAPPEPALPFDVVLPITPGLAAGNFELEAVVAAARQAVCRGGYSNPVVDPVSLGGYSDSVHAAGHLGGHITRLDPATLLVVGKPDSRVHSVLTTLKPGLLKNRLVITHGVFSPDELLVCGTISKGVIAANSLYPDELSRFVFEATHKLIHDGATLRETLDACREKLHGVGHSSRSSESLQGLLTVATPDGKCPGQIRARSSRARPG